MPQAAAFWVPEGILFNLVWLPWHQIKAWRSWVHYVTIHTGCNDTETLRTSKQPMANWLESLVSNETVSDRSDRFRCFPKPMHLFIAAVQGSVPRTLVSSRLPASLSFPKIAVPRHDWPRQSAFACTWSRHISQVYVSKSIWSLGPQKATTSADCCERWCCWKLGTAMPNVTKKQGAPLRFKMVGWLKIRTTYKSGHDKHECKTLQKQGFFVYRWL